MNEKITLHLFYTAVAAAIIALAAGCLVILGGVRQQARIRLDRQAAALEKPLTGTDRRAWRR